MKNRIKLFVCLFVALIAVDGNAQRVYQANKASSAPTIDGAVDAVWDSAVSAGDFKLLRTGGTTDGENSTVKVLWDDAALYLLFQSGLRFVERSQWRY